MPYMHKLSCRLALLKNVVLAVSAVGLFSCQLPEPRTGPVSSDPLARLDISPKSAVVRVSQAKDVVVVGFTAASDTAEIDVTFQVSGSAGGALTGTDRPGRGRAVGHYRAGNGTGRDTVVVTDTSGISDTSFVDVTQMPVWSVTVTPPSATLRIGTSATFTATTRDSTGAVLTGRAITWASTNAGVATVDGNGGAAAVAVGTASIIASSEGKSDTSVVTVTLVPVASVTVTPPSATVLVGQTAAFSATTRDSAGAILTGRVITWRSTATGVATVNASGVATGVSAGSASIIGTSEGRSDTSVVTVTAVPVASVTVTPATATVGVGGTAQFSATTRDSAGNVLNGRVITWASTATGIATVTGAGLARGVAVGSASIIATSEGKSDTSVVTVIVVPVASVTVTPASASVNVGATTPFSATTRDSAGGVLTGRVITWASTAPAVATVNATGVATGVSAGSSSIIATSEGKADTASLTVTVPPPPPPPPPPGAVADPTLLPRATGQHPMTGSYGRSLAAGQTYVDPNSGVTVLKLTSASVPVSNGGMYHGYSEGGPNISQPWVGTDGLTYYTAKVGDWLVDIRYSTFTSLNWRRVNYSGEIGFAFSLNPATPRIAYLANGKRIDRYNTGTNAIENTGHWPWNIAAAGTSADWLQSQMNDTWIVGMLQSNHTIVAFRPSDGFERAITEAASGVSIDEPHLDREFPYVYLSTNSSVQNKIVNLQTGAFKNPNDAQGINGDDHASPMRGKIVALTWMANGFIMVDTAGRVSATGAVNPSPTDWSGDWHQASQWVFNNPNEYFVVDQWADVGAYPIYRGMVGFVSLAGDIRLIAATDATGTSYTDGGQPHPTLSPDGKFVMWVTNMNGSGRFDTFIARVPVR